METWVAMSPQIADLERLEDFRVRMHDTMSPEDRDDLDADIENRFGDLRALLRDFGAGVTD
jgi:hypothetical protein